jgi:CRISPR-associated protein Cas2
MVLSEWFPAEHNASIIIVWEDSHAISGQSLVVMGEPPVDLVEIDGLLVTKRPLNTDLRS